MDLAYNAQGALQPEASRVWSFGLSLVQADGVGKSGTAQRDGGGGACCLGACPELLEPAPSKPAGRQRARLPHAMARLRNERIAPSSCHGCCRAPSSHAYPLPLPHPPAPVGLQRVRAPCLYIARIALFDRRANRFLGNVLGVRPESVGNYDKRWVFNPDERVIVRCGCVQVRSGGR